MGLALHMHLIPRLALVCSASLNKTINVTHYEAAKNTPRSTYPGTLTSIHDHVYKERHSYVFGHLWVHQ